MGDGIWSHSVDSLVLTSMEDWTERAAYCAMVIVGRENVDIY